MLCESDVSLFISFFEMFIFYIIACGFIRITAKFSLSLSILGIGFIFISFVSGLYWEFSSGHYLHFILFLVILPIMLLCIAIGYFAIEINIERKIVKREIELTPERIRKYIMNYGYTNKMQLVLHFRDSWVYWRANKYTSYPNPIFNAEARKQSDDRAETKHERIREEDLPLEEKEYVTYAMYALLKYTEYVSDKFKKELNNNILSFGMFQIEDICNEKMTAFKDFFKDDNNDFDIKTLRSVCLEVITPLLKQGDLIKISDDLYRCTSMTDTECNIVEGETLVI